MKRVFWGLILILTLTAGAFAQTTATAFERGIRRASAGQFEVALDDFRKAMERSGAEPITDATRSRIHFNAGACLYRLGRFVEAGSEFSRSIRLDPTYEKAFYSLGMTEAELGDWQTSADAFEAALRINKRNGETWFDLAYSYLALERNEDAERAFRNSIRFGSRDSHISHNNIGVLLAIKGRTRDAIREFETAIELSNGSLEIADDNLRFYRSSAKDLNYAARSTSR